MELSRREIRLSLSYTKRKTLIRGEISSDNHKPNEVNDKTHRIFVANDLFCH